MTLNIIQLMTYPHVLYIYIYIYLLAYHECLLIIRKLIGIIMVFLTPFFFFLP
jgi:hypothetical protein